MTMVHAADEYYMRDRDARDRRMQERRRASAERFYRIVHESRALYEGLIRSRSKGSKALELGCGVGSESLFMAKSGAKHVVGIDTCEASIAAARREARAAGLENTEYRRMNAEYLEFDDHSFDLVCGTGILQHLDLTRAYAELSRVLRPGGLAVFLEPLGHNPLINLYRRMTPDLRTGNGHPLLMRDIADAKQYFRRVTPNHFVLQSLAALPFHGRRSFRTVLSACEASDAFLFRVLPFMRRYSWQVILCLEEPLNRRQETGDRRQEVGDRRQEVEGRR